jgi:hypothetical protein
MLRTENARPVGEPEAGANETSKANPQSQSTLPASIGEVALTDMRLDAEIQQRALGLDAKLVGEAAETP